ncbi:MAG: hypothetical protein ACK5N8_08140 [Alphaproteobacteria bacterium]
MSSSINTLNEKRGGFDYFIKYVLKRNLDILSFDKAKEAYNDWDGKSEFNISRFVRKLPKEEDKFLRNLYKETTLDVYAVLPENKERTREDIYKKEPKREEVFDMKLPQTVSNMELIEQGYKKKSATFSVSQIIDNVAQVSVTKEEKSKSVSKEETKKIIEDAKQKYPTYVYFGVLNSVDKKNGLLPVGKVNAIKKVLDAYDEYEENYQENVQIVNTNFNIGENHDEFPFVDYANLPLNWKKTRRELFVDIAKTEGAQYFEDIDAREYKAGVKSKDGVVTKIVSKGQNDISFTAHDKKGRVIPVDLKYFEAAMKLARETGKPIKFGNFKNPETRARLLLACMVSDSTNDNKVNIFNKPTLDDKFWNGVSLETRAEIERMNGGGEKAKKALVKAVKIPENLNEKIEHQKTFVDTIVSRYNELNGKNGNAREVAEVEHIREFTRGGQALRANLQKYGTDTYSLSDEYKAQGVVPSTYISPNRKQQAGWSIVLNVVPNKNDSLTGKIMSYLRKNEINYYVGSRNLTGDAAMIISAGSYADMKKLSQALGQKFGKELPELNRAANISMYGKRMNPQMLAYFNVDRIYLGGKAQKLFKFEGNSVVKGISMPHLDSGDNHRLVKNSIENGLVSDKALNIIDSKTSQISELGDFSDFYKVQQIKALGAHEFYSEVLGEHYHGKDKKAFEKEMFADALPQEGTEERGKWEAVSKEYVAEIKQEKAKQLDVFNKVKEDYKPASIMVASALSGLINQPKTK